MKTKYWLICFLLVCSVTTQAQYSSKRTVKTIVADVLAGMPAPKKDLHDNLMKDLAATGEEGVMQLVKMMDDLGEGSNSQVKHALNGLSRYVSEKGREAERMTTANAYIKALDTITNPEIKAFITRQLKITETGDLPDESSESFDRDARTAVDGIMSTLSGEKARKTLQKEGFISLFNGKDLTGWKGLVGNPITRAKMKPAELAKAQKKADEQMRKDWKVENGLLIFDGTGYDNLCTVKQYGDFEMYIDWKLDPAGTEADAGIYLRGTPQVQMWDNARTNVGAQVGSGGLYNNQIHPSKPIKVADKAMGEWNTMYIKMTGDRVTVVLNGELVTDHVILENYWDRSLPIFPVEQIELQAHGSKVYYRNIYVKELKRAKPFELSKQEKKEGYKILFDGTNMYQWTGNTADYRMENGCIALYPSDGHGGNLYTKNEYGDFNYRFEFQLTPGANNGLGIRTPMEGDPAYAGMELQILDDDASIYKELEEYQYHGSIYGIISAKKGYLKPLGEWNYQEVTAKGDHIQIILNGTVILDGNIREAVKNGTLDEQEHPGLFNKKGHIGFLGHGSAVKFRNIRIKEL